ncbi:unnamed protein product [Ranitomeya imitator]|uniref:RNA 2-O ribose methyltransferase substrate binding domain-containing protein n=1 Tax=Ranitomeya imitator TaxID=111125 RepID=A0ABN9LJ28_9NEOB|nr:unnamed protein product [Ranitomeya imitator]
MSEIIYGIHAVKALLERARHSVFRKYLSLKAVKIKRLMPLILELETQGIVVQVANRQWLDEKSEGAVHQGIIARAKKVACGAAENVPLIRVTNLARTMRLLQEENVWIVGTAGEADHTLFQSKLTGAVALVMGCRRRRYETLNS